jgi:hypothetical protein
MKDLKNHLRKKSFQKKILKKEEHRLILRKTFSTYFASCDELR